MAGRSGADATGGLRLRALVGLAAIAALTLQPPAPRAGQVPSLLPKSFVPICVGPAGGIVWQGRIPNPALPELRRPSVIYLPPQVSTGTRYPVLYLLQGFRGSPWEFSSGLELAAVADDAIDSGAVRPFIAVAMPAGLTSSYDGEWAGPWEEYLVRDVVPWVDAHLPTIRTRAGRAIAGLSAGGFGAVDIGLRHPGLFGTLESWSGYFKPFRNGPLRHADARELAAHDPSLLVQSEAPLLRRLGTRFYLSSGSTADWRTAALAIAFAHELDALRLPHALYLRPGGHNGRFWLAQFPEALRYALPAPRRTMRA
jgi:enterochelin esterase-like enzyme